MSTPAQAVDFLAAIDSAPRPAIDREALALRVADAVGAAFAKLAEHREDIERLWLEFEALQPGETILGCSTKTEYCQRVLNRSIRAVQYLLTGRSTAHEQCSRRKCALSSCDNERQASSLHCPEHQPLLSGVGPESPDGQVTVPDAEQTEAVVPDTTPAQPVEDADTAPSADATAHQIGDGHTEVSLETVCYRKRPTRISGRVALGDLMDGLRVQVEVSVDIPAGTAKTRDSLRPFYTSAADLLRQQSRRFGLWNDTAEEQLREDLYYQRASK